VSIILANGNLLTPGGDLGEIKIWNVLESEYDIDFGKLIKNLNEHKSRVESIQVIEDPCKLINTKLHTN
jgi:hypothetical protein